MTPFDDRRCELGEGPLWHPQRGQLFWFDILGRRLLSRTDAGPQSWVFDEIVSAAGWVDQDTLFIASETRFFTFDLETGAQNTVAALDADALGTRSNDGRADPQGGFWIGTMGKSAEAGAGAIHRYYRGEVRVLFDGITIPNAICFAPDGTRAYFCDTLSGQIMTVALDALGWPAGAPEVFADLRAERLKPDGAVVDAAGNLWNAQWGAARVAGYAPDGSFIEALPVPAAHSSCPAFGGADLTTMFCTTAQEHLAPKIVAAEPLHGQTFATKTRYRGQPEPQVIL